MSTSSSSADSTLSRASAHAIIFDSSSSSRSSPFTGNYIVDRDGFLYSDHRAGGPRLCSPPDEYRPLSKAWEDQTHFRVRQGHVHDTVRSILQKHHVQYRELSIWGRKSRVDPEPQSIPTVRVITETIPPGARRAAREIHYALLESIPSLFISVDIVDSLLATPLRSFPVARTDSIFDKWNDIAHAILNALDTREWVALGCWRYGVGNTGTENPVTVVVNVEKRSTSEWSTESRRIRMILRGFGVTDVDILFRKDEIRRHVEDPELPQAACTKFAQPGVSLGIHSSTAGSSTLGGLVELQFPDQKWRTFGITCFHAVYAPERNRQTLIQVPGASEAFRRWKDHPVRPGNPMAPQLLRVDHPSLSDLRRAVASLAGGIADLKSDKFREIEKQLRARDTDPDDVFVNPKDEAKYHGTVRTIDAFEQQHQFFQSFIQNETYLLGPVFAGSGLWRARAGQDQRQDLTIVDWALIEIPKERLGENKPFSYKQSKPTPEFQDGGYLEHGKSYSKSGRSSGITTGIYSGLKEANFHHEQMEPVTSTSPQFMMFIETSWK
ncbi:hypothetical protein PMG11_05954 [Penicillium brasilianum]|uniref:Uncharacterized protein n=1 Tax=Penicillium brasilianum TaxID=104259 RepID=A0A0F7TKX4_PENBI|nr:hypothetical protein PMG11_05954 [Penicillium brasilianum]